MMKFGNKKEGNTCFQCTIRLLDDNDTLECEFQSFHRGRYLLDYVFNRLDIVEADYFGLRFVDSNKQRHWLDANKNILRQIKTLNPILFCFRVKFYPADPLKLHEEITRYYLFLQLRRDLLHGRLYCVPNDAATLAAYVLQADFGDVNPNQQCYSYISEYKILLKQTPKIEEKIMEIHQTLKGLSPAFAELYFLKKAATLDTYGVDPYTVKDQRGILLYLGLSHAGVLTFQGSKRTHHFRWAEVQKLNYEGKMFIVHLIFMEDARTKRKHTVGFKCPSASACRNLWRTAVEQRLFYTMDNSNKHGMVVTGGSFFSRGSRFRYQGRCEKEVVEDSATIVRDPPTVNRVSLKSVGKSTSLPTTPADSDNYDSVISRVHRPLPYIDRSASLDEEVLCDAESPTPPHDPYDNGSFAVSGGAYCPESTLPPISQLEPLEEDSENKFQNSSLSNNKYIDSDANHEASYYERPNQSYSPMAKLNVSNNIRKVSDPAKRLFRHSAIKDDDFLPSQIFCECDDPLRQDFDRDDTSSTDTLGPPTEPLDVPLIPKGSNSTFNQQQQQQQQQQYLSKSQTNNFQYDTKLEDISSRPVVQFTQRQKLLGLRVESFSIFVSNLFKFSRVFFITFIFVILTLGTLLIFIFESKLCYLDAIRSSRELVLLRVQYYEPLRNYVLSNLLNNNGK